jgi:hypothetical protein
VTQADVLEVSLEPWTLQRPKVLNTKNIENLLHIDVLESSIETLITAHKEKQHKILGLAQPINSEKYQAKENSVY